MTVSLTELQSGASTLAAIYTAFADGLTNLPADQAAVLDAVDIAAMVDPALAPLTVIEPLAESLLAWVIANNQSVESGALSPIGSGARGNIGSDGGAVS